jgi:ribosome-binding protein aMBF1 (putative translation factor)
VQWNETELSVLAETWGTLSPAGIRLAIYQRAGRWRSEKSIRVQASRLGLSSPPRLSPEDEDLIVALLEERLASQRVVQDLSDEAIAEKFEVPTSVVTRIRRSMRDEEQ